MPSATSSAAFKDRHETLRPTRLTCGTQLLARHNLMDGRASYLVAINSSRGRIEIIARRADIDIESLPCQREESG